MSRRYKWADLESLTEEQLIAAHDEKAKNTVVGLSYFLDEVRHRRQSRVAASVEKLTRWIFWLTVFVALLTLLNVGIAIRSSLLEKNADRPIFDQDSIPKSARTLLESTCSSRNIMEFHPFIVPATRMEPECKS